MSLLCGIYRLRPGAAVSDRWRSHLRSHLKRGSTGTVAEFDDGQLFVLKLDLGAFDDPGWAVDDRHVTALAGDAILGDGSGERDRADDMAILAELDPAALRPALAASRGYFNLVHYHRGEQRLALGVDRVGVRSLYLYRDADTLVFSGAMRLIETLPGIRLTTDLQGVLETAAFGVPLVERTRYREVRCLHGGTLLHFDGDRESRDRYWKFDRDACTTISTNLDHTLDELYAAFQQAVALRAGRRRVVFSALSGGLDSRSVTTELWRRGLEVHSLNISWQGSQDDVLARLYAQRLGLEHHFVPRPLEEAGNSLAQRLHALIEELGPRYPDLPSTRRQMWSGNGGSLGLGHTKMTREATALMNAGDIAGAAKHFINKTKFHLSGKLLPGPMAQWAEGLPFDSLMAELAQIHCAEPARALYVFRMEHDQRRLLAFHLEQIDLVSFEFIEPLFDPEVLRIVCRLPMAFCLYHHMYHEWLKRFPPEILTVAWQVYPGHEACPVPMPPGAFDQWKPPQRHSALHVARNAVRGALEYVAHLRRYRGVLRTDRVLAAYALQGLRIRDTSHLLKQVDLLGQALAHTASRVDLPPTVRHPG